ncbi:hypothetical protein GJ496_011508 [Pomphorhynchus laevis]|nr:hypothetical protein GJ496_011508 [Pomphorhynchus laevis]
MADISHFEEVVLNEEYKIWRKNVPYLYNLMFTHSLKWPSLSIDFLSDIARPEFTSVDSSDSGSCTTSIPSYSLHRVLIGTHTNSQEPNYIHIATLRIPDRGKQKFDSSTFDQQTQEHIIQGGSKNWANFKIDISICHGENEVNRALAMPQNPCVIATRSTSSDVLIFDYTKHPSKSTSIDVNAQLTLKKHESGGYGIQWNCVSPGVLATCGEDGLICCWDIGSGSTSPIWNSQLQNTSCNDVAWHNVDQDIIISGDAEGNVCLWDIRANSNSLIKKCVSNSEINCVAMNPICWQALAIGCENGQTALYDLRSMHSAVRYFSLGSNRIEQVRWSPHSESVFATSTCNRLHIWDISKHNTDKCSSLPSDLEFVHAGHVGLVYDFSWNQNEAGVIASVSADNLLQVWQPAFYK